MNEPVYTIRPHFWRLSFFFARLMGGIFILILAGGAVLTWVQGHTDRAVTIAAVAMASIPASAVLGILLAVICVPWNCTLTRAGIEGRSYLGFKRSIRYQDIGETPYLDNSQYVPMLWLTDRTQGKQLVILVAGLDIGGIHEQLLRLAGPANPLTRAFDPRG